MKQVGRQITSWVARQQLLLHSAHWRSHDYQADPDALHNLVDDPAYANDLQRLRETLGKELEKLDDPLLPVYRAKVAAVAAAAK